MSNEIIKLFDIPKDVINDNERQRRVYYVGGVSPTVLSRTDSTKIMVVTNEKLCNNCANCNGKKIPN